MRRGRSVAPLVAVLLLACAAAAWVWFDRGRREEPRIAHAHVSSSPAPVRPTATPAVQATLPPASQATPVTYIPEQPASTPAATSAPKSAPANVPAPEPLNPGSTPAPTQIPVEAATIAPRHIAPPVIRENPDAPPRIIAMTLSTPVAHGGETVWGTVETSSNVASVEARIAGYSSSMEKVGVGKFRMAYTVPKLPFFLRRTWTIEITARNTRGDAVSSSIPITIR